MAVNWSQWASLGKPEANISKPFVQRNQDGRLEVFAVGTGTLFDIWQRFPNAGWNDSWGQKDAPFGAVWHSWQEAPAWSGWHSLGSPPAKIRSAARLTLGRNQDGRFEAFLMGEDGAVGQIWQTQ